MENPLRGDAGLTVGDKRYILNFGVNAIVVLEKRLGVKASQLGQLLSDASFEQVRAMFAIGLQRHHKGISEEAAGDIMDEVGIMDAAKAISDAVSLAFPSKGDAAEGEAKAETEAS